MHTGTKSSIAGSKLTQLSLQDEIPFTVIDNLNMTLANEVARTVTGYKFEIPFILQNKALTINILGCTYHFGENPDQSY